MTFEESFEKAIERSVKVSDLENAAYGNYAKRKGEKHKMRITLLFRNSTVHIKTL